MLHHFKKPFEKLIHPISSFFIRRRISPNWITLAGLALVLGGAVCFAFRRFGLGVAIIAIGGILDGVDGKVARDGKMITRFGGFLDSTLDRIAEIAIGLGILISFLGTPYFPLASFLVFLSMTGALMTSYVRARGEAAGFDPKDGFLQRADRGVVLGVCALIAHNALLVGVAAVALIGYVTVGQRIYLVWRGTRDLDPAQPQQSKPL